MLLQVAFNMSSYTALLIIADRTHSPFSQAQFYAALTIPAFVFGLIAGPVVEMVDRKKLMLATDLLMAVCFFLFAFTQGNVLLIFLLAFLSSSIARFFIPAEAATIPLLVSEDTLEHANTFFLFTLLGSVLLGYTIAGPIIQLGGGLRTFGETLPFFVASTLLIVGFLLRLSLAKIEHIKPEVPDGHIFKKTFHLFFETVKEVKSNVSVSLPILLLVFVELMIGMLSIVLLEYVRRYLLLPLTSVSYVLMIPLVVGLVVGVVFLGKIAALYGKRKSIFFGILLTGLILIILGALPYFLGKSPQELQGLRIASVVAAFLMGIAVVVISVQARTILQKNAKAHMHGRIFSFLDIMIALVTPIPVLFVGFAADKVSLLGTLIAIGLGIILLTYSSHKLILRKQS